MTLTALRGDVGCKGDGGPWDGLAGACVSNSATVPGTAEPEPEEAASMSRGQSSDLHSTHNTSQD